MHEGKVVIFHDKFGGAILENAGGKPVVWFYLNTDTSNNLTGIDIGVIVEFTDGGISSGDHRGKKATGMKKK